MTTRKTGILELARVDTKRAADFTAVGISVNLVFDLEKGKPGIRSFHCLLNSIRVTDTLKRLNTTIKF